MSTSKVSPMRLHRAFPIYNHPRLLVIIFRFVFIYYFRRLCHCYACVITRVCYRLLIVFRTDSAHALFVRATYLVCHRLISTWKSDLNVSLAALELLSGLARIQIRESGK